MEKGKFLSSFTDSHVISHLLNIKDDILNNVSLVIQLQYDAFKG